MLSKLEAIAKLRGYDHAFIFQKAIDEVTAPFSAKQFKGIKTYESPNEIKGLSLPHSNTEEVHQDKRGYYAVGLDAQVLAMMLCNRLGVEYESKFGRGSQLRACCDALENSLTQSH